MNPYMGGPGTDRGLIGAGMGPGMGMDPMMMNGMGPAGYYNGMPYNNGFNQPYQQGFAAGESYGTAKGVVEGAATAAALCCCCELCCCCCPDRCCCCWV